MPISPGVKLGPYEILAPLGAGGMGEVYRARDTRLDRTVAVKVLPSHVADRPELRQRFEREARAVSSLNHPNICVLYDIGRQDGIDFIVMEYLEGETLAARLGRGPLASEQVLRCAIQIADALGQAHRQGVFHRDLKPGNIMLTKAGAKLLDFGLAKLRGPESSSVIIGDSALPTVQAGLTQKGTILGTFQYMAPEQLEGKESDGRADIFSFGAVVYEMATGRKAFGGSSHASLIASILSAEPPPISTIQPVSPPALDRAIQRCLAKDPDERWQTALDLASELKWIAGGSGQEAAPATQVAPPVSAPRLHVAPAARRPVVWMGLAAIATLAALLLTLALFYRPAPEVRAVKLSLLPPEKAAFSSVSLSPDGRRVAFAASQSGKTQLWIRPLDSLSAQPLAGTEEAMYPFWSPDSRFVGFFAQGKLKKIDASGGPPQTLCDAQLGRGGAWNRDGVILFTPGSGAPLLRVQAAGGEAKPVTTLDQARQENTHRWPWFLPDGRHYVFFVRSSQRDNGGIYLGDLDSKEKKRLLGDESNVAYAPPAAASPGHLLFARNSILMAQPFDAQKLQFTGDPFPVTEQTGYDAGFARSDFSVSDNGVLVYNPTPTSSQDQLTWFDRDGKRLGAAGSPGAHWQPSLSPDEKTVVVDQLDPQAGSWDLYLIDLARDISTRFTFDPKNDIFPIWSADGGRIAFASNRSGPFHLHQKISSGAGEDELLWKSQNWEVPDDFSRDGRFLAYADQDPKTKWDLWVLPLSGDRKPVPFLRTEFNESWARFSPDGKWIAYVSDESKKDEVYVQSFPASGGKWQISTGGGSRPQWRRDGKEIFYLSADKKIVAVEVKADSTFHAGVPKALFDARFHSGGFPSFTVTGDGRRFLLPTLLGEAGAPQPAAVVLNWTAGIKR